MNDRFDILIVDDEPNIRGGLVKGLEKLADGIDTAGDATEALQKFQNKQYQLAIVDVRLPGGVDGLQLLSQLHQYNPNTTIIVITAHGTVETAVDAMRRGAFDFISKPVDLNLIRQQVKRAAEHHRLQAENRELRDRLANVDEITGIIGNSTMMREVFRQIRQVADTDATVVIEGESGTGKELIANALHEMSSRSREPFIAVNLGALPESLLESELFGHEKGSFSGATRLKPGCFERAQGGTLFLDEVTEMSPKSQVDLLRVLETGQYTRVGGETVNMSDARIISATNKKMPQLIEIGAFREDLYYRLNVVPITIPTLRDRREDIPFLVEHFLVHFCHRHHRPLKQFDDIAMNAMLQAKWPGNVRQLRNLVERLVVTISDETIGKIHLPVEILPDSQADSSVVQTLAEATENAEKHAIQLALHFNDFHREHTAESLGISVRSLHYKMSRYGLHST